MINQLSKYLRIIFPLDRLIDFEVVFTSGRGGPPPWGEPTFASPDLEKTGPPIRTRACQTFCCRGEQHPVVRRDKLGPSSDSSESRFEVVFQSFNPIHRSVMMKRFESEMCGS